MIPHSDKAIITAYDNWSSAMAVETKEEDPLLALRGSGKELWADEHADEYERRLREGWE